VVVVLLLLLLLLLLMLLLLMLLLLLLLLLLQITLHAQSLPPFPQLAVSAKRHSAVRCQPSAAQQQRCAQ
jgi:hypothetical protein